MDNEIILAQWPFGRACARNLVLLRAYIEHRLVVGKSADAFSHAPWSQNQHDPTWQAICHYYGAIIRAQIEGEPRCKSMEPIGAAIERGAVLPGFVYPEDCHKARSRRLLKPMSVLLRIGDAVEFYGRPPLDLTSPPLSQGGFLHHLRSTTPAQVIRLVRKKARRQGNILCLDDGQFVFGIRPLGDDETESCIVRQDDDFRNELFEFWLRDIARRIKPRDVVLADGTVINAFDTIESCLKQHPHWPEAWYLVLSAVDQRLWPDRFKDLVFEKLRKAVGNGPEWVEGFLRRNLNEVQRMQLPADLFILLI